MGCGAPILSRRATIKSCIYYDSIVDHVQMADERRCVGLVGEREDRILLELFVFNAVEKRINIAPTEPRLSVVPHTPNENKMSYRYRVS